MNLIEASEILRWKWLWGLPRPIWYTHEKFVKSFIEENKLKPILGERAAMEHIGRERAIDIKYLIDIRGGKRTPHLHYRGDLYLMDAGQWKQFSNTIVKDLSKKLAAAKTVNFEQFMEVADAVGAIP